MTTPRTLDKEIDSVRARLSIGIKGRNETLVAEYDQLKQERLDLLTALDVAIAIVENAKPGSFDNGNVEAGHDEGDVLTSRWVDETRALIKKVRAP